MGYIEGVLHSIMKRKKQVMKIWMTIMAVAGVITIIVALGDSLKAYQKAINQKVFGKWYIMETSTSGKTSVELSAHPYLTGYGEVINVSDCYGADYTQNNYRFGYMDKDACDIASLSLEQGNMPQNNDEIAVEKDTLLKLGYNCEPGQIITVYYYDKSGGNDNILSKKCSKEYKLVGIIENYASYWNGGKYVPTLLITKEEAESYGYIDRQTYLYTLDENIHTRNYRQVYEGMKEQVSTNTEYNSRVYDYESTDFDGMTAYAAVFAAVIGMVAGFAVLLAYHRARAGCYILYYHMGVEINALLRGVLIEGLLIEVSSCAAGIVAGAGIVSVVMEAAALFQHKAAVSVSADSLIKAILITGVLCLILVISGVVQAFLEVKTPKIKILQVKAAKIKGLSTQGRSVHKRGNGKIRNPQLLYVLRSLQKEKTTAMLRVALTMAVFIIITFCIKGIADTNEDYLNIDKKPDLIISRNGFVNSKARESDYSRIKLDDIDIIVNSQYFEGKLDLFEYMSEDIIQGIENTEGVNEVGMQLIENNAMFSYYDFKMYQKFVEENGIKALEDCTQSVKGDTYYMPVFPGTSDCTYYVKPTEELYEELSGYILEEYINYSEFKEGGQLFIFNFTDETGIYNKTYKTGETKIFPYGYIGNHGVGNFKNENTLMGKLINKYRIVTSSSEITEEESARISHLQWDKYKNNNQYVTVAGVIYMDEEKKAEFYKKFPVLKELPSRNVIIMSDEFIKKMYNIYLSAFFEILGEEYPSDEGVVLSGNVLCVNYGLDSIYKATDNILQAYFQKEGYSFISNVEENDICRINYINKILSYMITIIGLSVIYFLVIIIWNCFRFAEEKDKLKLYSELGAEQSKLSGIGIIRFGIEAGMAVFGGIIISCAVLSYKYCVVYLFTAAVITLLCGVAVRIIYSRGLRQKDRG